MPIQELLDELLTSLDTGPHITTVRHFDARPPSSLHFPRARSPAGPVAQGARRALYSHQARAFRSSPRERTWSSSRRRRPGKTGNYARPQALVQQPDSRVLYLFPTKAWRRPARQRPELANALPDMRMFTYDGDTPQDARRSVRARANLVLTNPDMLHSGILPHHTKWVNCSEPPLRRHRRAARLSRRLRQPSR